MTRKLEELFDLPKTISESIEITPIPVTQSATQSAIADINNTIDKIDQALPAVKGLDASDQEMDDIASKAQETFDNLMDLGFNVDSRYASEIFAVAGAMLGHALTAKTAKLNKKLKIIELQMKKVKLDRDVQGDEPSQTAHGQVLSRNDLLEMLKGANDQKNKEA
jgi:hypothetical protein